MPKTKQLTITQATAQARRHVDKLMPGQLATVESRLSADPQTLESLVVTTITFPENHHNAEVLSLALRRSLAGARKVELGPARIVLTRVRDWAQRVHGMSAGDL